MNRPMDAAQVATLVPGWNYVPEFLSRKERRLLNKKSKLNNLFKSMSKQIEDKQFSPNGSLEAETE